MPGMRKRWALKEAGETAPLSSFLDVHPVALRLLASRGVTDPAEVESFFRPSWESGVHDPFSFSRMRDAVARAFAALDRGERITVHGDYDADGVTGSAVLISTLREIASRSGSSAIVESYIPHRDREGYGLHAATVGELAERGTGLIITVDCGIACVREIALAKERGIDTIVVDHHQFGEDLPDAILIHPKLPGETYPFPHLAAVGVAWKVAFALLAEARSRGVGIPEGWEKWLLDLVSIATVTDMVPLVGENRVLETYGLKVLNKTRRPGLLALFDAAGLRQGEITSESVAFSVGPRINAAGRMNHASLALNLLLAESLEEARMLAAEVEAHNRERQKATAKLMLDAERQLGAAPASNILIFRSEEWPPALVGLVAGKYLDAHGKPVVAIGKHGGRWVGSGRSFAEYDITDALRRAGDGILTHVGGHVQACGFSFPDGDASAFETLFARLVADAEERLTPDVCTPSISVDLELSLDDIDWPLVDALAAFEPFGEGNRRPLFMTRGLELVACDLVGSAQSHVRCAFRSPSGRTMKFIGFKFGDRIGEFGVGRRLDVVYDVGVNEWNGRRDLQLKIVDVREA